MRLADLDEVEVTVDKLVAGGDGLARFEGIPIFVARSAPGDRLRVRITERRPDYGRAEIVELLAPGPGRRQPPCPYFAECGGCDLQHLEDPLQVELKAAATRETLERVGRIAVPEPVEVVAGAPWGYRVRTTLHTEADAAGVRVGFFQRGSNRLVPVARCPILVPELESLLPDLPQRLDPVPRRLDLLAGDDGAVSSAPVTGDLPHGEVVVTAGGIEYRLDARCFFQAHRTLVDALVERAVGPWEGALAIDLYAGVGLSRCRSPVATAAWWRSRAIPFRRVMRGRTPGATTSGSRSCHRRSRPGSVRCRGRPIGSSPTRPAAVCRVPSSPPCARGRRRG